MSPVTYRKIETHFEREARRPGGKKVSEALIDAHANLGALEPRTLPCLEEGLDTLRGLVGNSRDRPSEETLREIYGIADNLIGYCLTVNRPGLDQVLQRMARLSDAIRASDLWLPGTFAPLTETYQLALEGALDLAQISILIENIDLCIARYEQARRA